MLFLLQSSCFFNANIRSLDSVNPQAESGNQDPAPIPEVQNLTTSKLIATESSLVWNSGGSQVISYKIVISSSTSPEEYCASGSAISLTTTSIDLPSLTPDTTYYFRVCSIVDGKISKGTTSSFKTLKLIARSAAYNSFTNWNDYLSNDGSKIYTATQTVCPGNTASLEGYNTCINGGLIQKIVIPIVLDCTKIKANDYLTAFEWSCDTTGSDTIIYSTDLKPKKGLQTLISGTEFKNNYVLIQIDGVSTYSSIPEKWWSNLVEELPDSPAGSFINLDNGASVYGKIYVANSNKSGGGYRFSANKTSLVISKGVTLVKDNSATNSLISSSAGVKYIWIEGQFSGNNISVDLMSFAGSAHFRLKNIEIKNSLSIAINLVNSTNNIISDFHIHHCKEGIQGSSSTSGNLILDGVFSNCNSDLLTDIYYSRISRIIFSHNANSINDSLIYKPFGSIVSYITSVNNTVNYGYRLAFTNGVLIHNHLNVNSNNQYLIYAFSVGSSTFSQIMSFGSSFSEVAITNTSGHHKFTNNLVLENSAECNIVNNTGFSPGLSVGTCLNHGPLSNANLTLSSADYTKFFVGKVINDDTINSSDSLGSALFSNIIDWIDFSNLFRVWGVDGNDFPNSNNKGVCSSGACRIWDYRLKSDSANLAFNSTNTVLTKNEPFIVGAICPSAINGNVTTTYVDTNSTSHSFLTNAYEIIGDGIGNEDTLCESNESCIYTPNFGAYQGEGDYKSQGTCQFQNGTLSNIKIYTYPTNGN